MKPERKYAGARIIRTIVTGIAATANSLPGVKTCRVRLRCGVGCQRQRVCPIGVYAASLSNVLAITCRKGMSCITASTRWLIRGVDSHGEGLLVLLKEDHAP